MHLIAIGLIISRLKVGDNISKHKTFDGNSDYIEFLGPNRSLGKRTCLGLIWTVNNTVYQRSKLWLSVRVRPPKNRWTIKHTDAVVCGQP